MKKKNKILLFSSLATLSTAITVATPVVLTSCSDNGPILDQFKCRLLSSYFASILNQLSNENQTQKVTTQAFDLSVNKPIVVKQVQSYLDLGVIVKDFSSDQNNIYINLKDKFYRNSTNIPSSTTQFSVYVKGSQIVLNKKNCLSGPFDTYMGQIIYNSIFNSYGQNNPDKINYGASNILQANEILSNNQNKFKEPIVDMFSNETDISNIRVTSNQTISMTLTNPGVCQNNDIVLSNGVKISKNNNTITLRNLGMFSNELSDIDMFYCNAIYSAIFNTDPKLPDPKKLDFGAETLDTAKTKLNSLKQEIELSVCTKSELDTSKTLVSINNQTNTQYIQITFKEPVFKNNSSGVSIIIGNPQANFTVNDRTIIISTKDMFNTNINNNPVQPQP